MFSVVIRHTIALAVAFIVAAAMPSWGPAGADPGQDQKFFDLLGQKDIPPVDGEDGLIITAHKVCSKLDEGMPVGDMVELIRNNGFNDNPLTRLQNQGRITRTIHQFIGAAVEAYCPYDKGKIASIAKYMAPDRSDRPRVVRLASVVVPLPAGEIGPTKPVPIPAQPPPTPEQLAPAPQQAPPPPPKRVPPAPPKQQQVAPPPQEAPPQESPPDADMPQAPAPAPGGAPGGSPAPENPAPEPPPSAPPAPPGHVRLAP
jgi:hypothetical protein